MANENGSHPEKFRGDSLYKHITSVELKFSTSGKNFSNSTKIANVIDDASANHLTP
jgi:hypothetical protein